MSLPSTIAADVAPVSGGPAGRKEPAAIAGRKASRLVILGSSITALATAREAHNLGLKPVVTDHAPGIAHRSSLVEGISLDSGSESQYLGRICALGGSDACLIADGDLWLRFIRRNREALESAFCAVLHPSNETLDICLNKAAFATWCVANGFDTPRCCRADDAACLQAIRYPVLVRPHHRPNSALPKAAEARSSEELVNLVAQFRAAGAEPLVSESLLARRLTQYSIPFAKRGAEMISFVARKVRPPADWCGTGTCVELSPDAEVERVARRAVEALDYFGIGEVEILHAADDGRRYLIEINARPWMQYSLATAAGHGFLGFLLRPDQRDRRAAVTEGHTWLNFSDDLYVCFSSSQGIVRRGRLPLADYFKSVLRANAYARFSWRDPKPWLWDSLERLKSLASR